MKTSPRANASCGQGRAQQGRPLESPTQGPGVAGGRALSRPSCAQWGEAPGPRTPESQPASLAAELATLSVWQGGRHAHPVRGPSRPGAAVPPHQRVFEIHEPPVIHGEPALPEAFCLLCVRVPATAGWWRQVPVPSYYGRPAGHRAVHPHLHSLITSTPSPVVLCQCRPLPFPPRWGSTAGPHGAQGLGHSWLGLG